MRTSYGKLRDPSPQPILGVDPGTSACGLALLDGWGAYLMTVRPKGRDLPDKVLEILLGARQLTGGMKLAYLAIEHMQVYEQRKSEGDPNDLINLAVVGGACLGALVYENAWLPQPRQWNGGVPKKVRHARLREKAIDGMTGRVSEHAMDALGLALQARERLKWLHRSETSKH